MKNKTALKLERLLTKQPKNKVLRFIKNSLLFLLGLPLLAIDYFLYFADRLICSIIPTMTLPRYATWTKETDWKIYAVIRIFVVLVLIRLIF